MTDDATANDETFPYTLTREKQSRIIVEVEISQEERQASEKTALAKLGSAVKAKGFRPGNVPEAIVKEKVKEETLLEEIIHDLMPKILKKIMKKEKIEAILHPKIEVKSTNPLALSIIFVEEPQAKIQSLNKKEFAKKEHKVDEKDIDRVVEQFLKEQVKETSVNRAAQDGDLVLADFWGEDESGKEIEGTRTEGYRIEIGSNTLIPGFEEGVKGMNKGDKKDLKLTFPENYQAEHLRNKQAVFHITIKEVKELEKSALTKELIKAKIGTEKTPEEFRKEIEKSLIEQEEHMDKERRERALLDAIAKATTIDLAPELIDEEQRALFANLERSLEQQNATLEDWMKWQKKKPEELHKEMKESAIKRLTVRFGMKALMAKDRIDVTADEIKQKREELAAHAHPDDTHTHELRDEQVEWELKVQKLFKMYLD